MNITLICADDDKWALGMRSISAALRAAGHETRMIFASSPDGRVDRNGLESIRALSADSRLIGISSMSRASRKAKAIIQALQPLGVPVVWGGMHPTLFPEDCAGHGTLICRGEGELFMIELADQLSSGADLVEIPNGGHKVDGKTIVNAVRPLIGDLDRLALPDFSFEDEFFLDGKGNPSRHGAMRDAASIMFSGSRGCACNCHYCSNGQLMSLYRGKGRFLRKMSIPRFVESAAAMREMFPKAKKFYFTDEDFFTRPSEELRDFAETYPAKVGLPFECMASPQQITEEKMDLLVKAGMWRIDVGVESGSDRVKKEIFNRPVSNATVRKAAAVINRHPRVVAYYFFIIGNPYEDRKDLLETIDLLRSLPSPNYLRTYNLVFIPGTVLFEKAVRDGIIKGIEDSGFEMDFLAGLEYRNHAWKQNNLYLNGLISLMTGRSTRRRLGFMPRILIPTLIDPRMIDFIDRHPVISTSFITLAGWGLRMRRKAAESAFIIFKDPRVAYDPQILKQKILGCCRTSNPLRFFGSRQVRPTSVTPPQGE